MHALGHDVARGIGVEAAVDRQTVLQERTQPRGIGSGTGGGETAVVGMQGVTADGVDGRFA